MVAAVPTYSGRVTTLYHWSASSGSGIPTSSPAFSSRQTERSEKIANASEFLTTSLPTAIELPTTTLFFGISSPTMLRAFLMPESRPISSNGQAKG